MQIDTHSPFLPTAFCLAPCPAWSHTPGFQRHLEPPLWAPGELAGSPQGNHSGCCAGSGPCRLLSSPDYPLPVAGRDVVV